MTRRTSPPRLAGLLVLLTVIGGKPLASQELWGPMVPRGDVRLTLSGVFESADEFLGSGGNGSPLAGDFLGDDVRSIFPGYPELRSALRTAAELSDWEGVGGELRATAQVSRVEVPLELRAGVLDRLTIGFRTGLAQDRVESTFALLPAEGADLGINPVIGAGGEVLGFVDGLAAAVDELGADSEFDGFAEAVRAAYLATGVFPIAGSAAALALDDRLARLDEARVAAGLSPFGESAIYAQAALDDESLIELLTDPSGPYRLLRPGTALPTWKVNDFELFADFVLLRNGDLSSPEGHGLTVHGAVRLPTAVSENPNALFDVGTGDGNLDLVTGADAWLRRTRWGIAGDVRFVLPQAATRSFRLRADGDPFGTAVNFHSFDWTPGGEMRLRLLGSLAPVPGIWFDLGWDFARRGEATFERTTPAPPEEPVVFAPRGPIVLDTGVLEDESEWTRHRLGVGLRYRPPQLADGRMEVWSRWVGTVAGSGPGTPAWTRVEFGGRIWRSLW